MLALAARQFRRPATGEERAIQVLQLVIVIYLCVEGLLLHSVLIKTSQLALRTLLAMGKANRRVS